MNCYLYFFSASETRVFSQRNRKKQHTYIGKFQETCNTHQMLRSIRRRNRLDLEEKIQKKERFQLKTQEGNHRKLNSMEVQFFELYDDCEGVRGYS